MQIIVKTLKNLLKNPAGFLHSLTSSFWQKPAGFFALKNLLKPWIIENN